MFIIRTPFNVYLHIRIQYVISGITNLNFYTHYILIINQYFSSGHNFALCQMHIYNLL